MPLELIGRGLVGYLGHVFPHPVRGKTGVSGIFIGLKRCSRNWRINSVSSLVLETETMEVFVVDDTEKPPPK
jgi:ABC-type amino acid transport system permease subunit